MADPKQKALQGARRAQARFEKTQKQLEESGLARRESFVRARKAGATLREIGDDVGLHHTRVGQIIRGKVAVWRESSPNCYLLETRRSGPRRRANASRGPDHKEATLLMANPNPTDCEHVLAVPAAEDRKVQSAVLEFLIGEGPDRFTIPELSRAMNAGPADFGAEDAIERAVRELVGAGLLHCCGGFVLPTRAALCYRRLVL